MTTLAIPFTLTFGHIFLLALAIIFAIFFARLAFGLIVAGVIAVFTLIVGLLAGLVGLLATPFLRKTPRRIRR
jgi:hypothetical protein